MRVLVTGGNGFIGQHVCRALAEHGHEPVIFERRRFNPPQPTDGWFPQILGDTRDHVAVTQAVAESEGVIHLAGVLGTAETISDPRPAIETNIYGAVNVFEAASKYKVPVVNIAVGNHWMPNPYSITKSTAERFAEMYSEYHGLTIAVVRALNAYGPGQVPPKPYGPSSVRKIIPTFICRALDGKPIEIYGNGEQIMDMVYVTDVAEILVRALGSTGNFEAGTGRATTVNQIARAVLAAVGGGTLNHQPMRQGEPADSVVLGDPSTLLPLDFKDFVPLEDGVANTVEHYR